MSSDKILDIQIRLYSCSLSLKVGRSFSMHVPTGPLISVP
jgi:hypothetical protein